MDGSTPHTHREAPAYQAGAPASDQPTFSGLSLSERALIAAVRGAEKRTITVETRGAEIRCLHIDEPIALDVDEAGLEGTLRRLLSEFSDQDITIRRRNGRILPVLYRVLHSRYH